MIDAIDVTVDVDMSSEQVEALRLPPRREIPRTARGRS
jgi:hypothetical protein